MKSTLKLIVTAIILIAYQNSEAQNCPVKFESDAGPDIDACSGGQVNLSGVIGGDARQGVWKGGKGIFEPSRTALEAHYFPADDEKGTVVLTLEASKSKYPGCVPVSSKTILTIHKEPHVTAGESQRIQAGMTVDLKGTLTGDARQLIWMSSGSGTFSNANELNAVYTPSKSDIKNGGCSLTLVAEPFTGCPPESASISISISANKQVK